MSWQSGKCPQRLESVQSVCKLFGQPVNCLHSLETVHTDWKVSGQSVNCPKSLNLTTLLLWNCYLCTFLLISYNPRTFSLSGKYLHDKSCYPESFWLFCLWSVEYSPQQAFGNKSRPGQINSKKFTLVSNQGVTKVYKLRSLTKGWYGLLHCSALQCTNISVFCNVHLL